MRIFLTSMIGVFLLLFNSSGSIATETPELPVYTFPKAGNKLLLIYLSGDGGMNSFSKSLIKTFNDRGYAVVALDTRKYFWEKKTPVQFAKDLQQMIEHYTKSWNKADFALIGYSFGADVAAFVPPLLSQHVTSRLKSTILLSPGFSTGFVTKISNMLGMGSTDKDPYKVYPQLLKSPVPVLCIFGAAEESDFYPAIKPSSRLKKILVPGSHKYNDDVNLLAGTIIQEL